MNFIFQIVTIGLILLNLTGLTLAAKRLTESYALAKIAAPAALCLGMFFIEHIVGLGNLFWLWPLTTAVSAYLVVTRHAALCSHWKVEAVFLVGFAYVLFWRYAFPDIDPSSERLTNLHFIGSYMPGTTLPPVDTWLPPYKLDFYYTFQHYSAALMGRLFGLDAGTSYNLAFCVIYALAITAGVTAVSRFCTSNGSRVIATAAFALGGSGAWPSVHFMIEQPSLWSSMRFIGDVAQPTEPLTDFGRWLVGLAFPPQLPLDHPPEKLPTETFGYLASLGDYHAPLGGFMLLTLALACIALLHTKPHDRSALAVLVVSVPLSIITNAWTFPLQAALVGTWLIFQHATRRSLDWSVLIVAGAASVLLIYPHLRGFAIQSLDFKTGISLVPDQEHTPWALGLVLHWPLLGILALSVFQRKLSRLTIYFAVLWSGLFLFSEFFHVDDLYGGEFNRFNTTLKWWPWIQAGALLTLGAMNLSSPGRVSRYGSAAVLLATAGYGYDLGNHWVNTPKTHVGRLDGAAWVTDDPIEKVMLDFLKNTEPGIVLERAEQGAYTYAPAMAMFSSQRSLLGWVDHERVWRGYRTDLAATFEQIGNFYTGKLPNSTAWLLQNQVRYVLWLKRDNIEPYDAFDTINAQIQGQYDWKEFSAAGQIRVGMWVRRFF